MPASFSLPLFTFPFFFSHFLPSTCPFLPFAWHLCPPSRILWTPLLTFPVSPFVCPPFTYRLSVLHLPLALCLHVTCLWPRASPSPLVYPRPFLPISCFCPFALPSFTDLLTC